VKIDALLAQNTDTLAAQLRMIVHRPACPPSETAWAFGDAGWRFVTGRTCPPKLVRPTVCLAEGQTSEKAMRTILILATISLALAAVGARAAATGAYVGHNLAKLAAVPLDRAQEIALKARPGTVTDRELEKESGGSGLRWSFDITSQGKAFEVGIDARTGKVLENKSEGLHPD
jgi:uncharacterized membrane protein YkoI